jgi:hypothetical protein
MSVGDQPAESAGFERLLVESGLATTQQITAAATVAPERGIHFDEHLVEVGAISESDLLAVQSHAWKLPPIDLGTSWVDSELVCQWPGNDFIDANWMPVRDQANGAILVATARPPAADRDAEIAGALGTPVEFAAATAGDIRRAVFAAFDEETRRPHKRGYRGLGRRLRQRD